MTSDLKAAVNGVPSLSVLDGWWMDGHIEGVTGWSVGETWHDPSEERASLYEKLEGMLVPMFYGQPTAYAQMVRSAIAINGSAFNAQRMVLQYIASAYAGHGEDVMASARSYGRRGASARGGPQATMPT